jgi:hypothetical protein
MADLQTTLTNPVLGDSKDDVDRIHVLWSLYGVLQVLLGSLMP